MNYPTQMNNDNTNTKLVQEVTKITLEGKMGLLQSTKLENMMNINLPQFALCIMSLVVKVIQNFTNFPNKNHKRRERKIGKRKKYQPEECQLTFLYQYHYREQFQRCWNLAIRSP